MANSHLSLSFFLPNNRPHITDLPDQTQVLQTQPRSCSVETKNKTMASTSAVSMALPPSHTAQKRVTRSEAFLKPLSLPNIKPLKKAAARTCRLEVKASSFKEKAVTGLTAAALTASIVMPDVAEAAGLTPSLKNFLLSIVAGGLVLAILVGAVIGVANFDPVKRG